MHGFLGKNFDNADDDFAFDFTVDMERSNLVNRYKQIFEKLDEVYDNQLSQLHKRKKQLYLHFRDCYMQELRMLSQIRSQKASKLAKWDIDCNQTVAKGNDNDNGLTMSQKWEIEDKECCQTLPGNGNQENNAQQSQDCAESKNMDDDNESISMTNEACEAQSRNSMNTGRIAGHGDICVTKNDNVAANSSSNSKSNCNGNVAMDFCLILNSKSPSTESNAMCDSRNVISKSSTLSCELELNEYVNQLSEIKNIGVPRLETPSDAEINTIEASMDIDIPIEKKNDNNENKNDNNDSNPFHIQIFDLTADSDGSSDENERKINLQSRKMTTRRRSKRLIEKELKQAEMQFEVLLKQEQEQQQEHAQEQPPLQPKSQIEIQRSKIDIKNESSINDDSNNEKEWFCKHCKKVWFESKSDYKMHLKQEHSKQYKKKLKIISNLKNEFQRSKSKQLRIASLKQIKGRKRQMKDNNNNNNNNQSMNMSNENKKEKCHKSESMLKCKYCKSTFIRARDLKCHIQKMHGNDLLYHCQLCMLKFVTKEKLDKHFKQCKQVNRPCVCRTCHKRFSTKNALTAHQQTQHTKH